EQQQRAQLEVDAQQRAGGGFGGHEAIWLGRRPSVKCRPRGVSWMGWNWLFGQGNKPRAPVIVALLVLLNALILRASDPQGLARLRDFAFDSYQRLQPREVPADMPVRIVDIDEAALAEYGQWPWPRNLLARLVDKLTEKNVAVIAFDAVFAEPDRVSLAALVRNLPAGEQSGQLHRLAETPPDNDKGLAEAIARGNVVTGFAFEPTGAHQPPRRPYGFAHNSGELDERAVPQLMRLFIPEQTGVVTSLEMFEKVAKGNGAVTTDIESAIVRRVPML